MPHLLRRCCDHLLIRRQLIGVVKLYRNLLALGYRDPADQSGHHFTGKPVNFPEFGIFGDPVPSVCRTFLQGLPPFAQADKGCLQCVDPLRIALPHHVIFRTGDQVVVESLQQTHTVFLLLGDPLLLFLNGHIQLPVLGGLDALLTDLVDQLVNIDYHLNLLLDGSQHHVL